MIMMVTWSFASFAYFMVPFYLKNVKGNFYHLTLASESAELTAAIACTHIQKRMSLQKSMVATGFCIIIGGILLTMAQMF